MLMLRSVPSVVLEDQAEKLPDSKLSAKTGSDELGCGMGVDVMGWVAPNVGVPVKIDVGVDDWTAVAGWVRDGGSVAPEVGIGPWGVSVNSDGSVVGVAVNDEI